MSCILKPLFLLSFSHEILFPYIFAFISSLLMVTLSPLHQQNKKAPQKVLFLPPRTTDDLREAQDPHKAANSLTLFPEKHFCYNLVKKCAPRVTRNFYYLKKTPEFVSKLYS